ncbi:MAG: hypothetical protein IJB24_00505 [Clostridia bacterium]|nr:hypothetical protein [Clostridia bacterium]
MNNAELSFFASANSGRGFINYYGDIFKGLKKHYIIKGGPGTGKSSLMKAIATKAETKGMKVERFYCSSDPESLDGIIISDISVGITDGTAPHTADPKCPGVTDEIIDLGSFWDKSILADSKDIIIESVNKKAKLYRDVYSYLNAALTLDSIKQRRTADTVDITNLQSLARSYTDVIPYRRGKQSVRLIDGITMKGHHCFAPYRTEAEMIYNVKDSYGTGYIFLNYLKKSLSGNEMTVSYDALDTEKVNMIYIPTDKILFCINSDQGEEINIDEFVIGHTEDGIETRKAELLSNAYQCLSDIEKLHFSLEEIYISAMDFPRKEKYQKKLIKEIFT